MNILEVPFQDIAAICFLKDFAVNLIWVNFSNRALKRSIGKTDSSYNEI